MRTPLEEYVYQNSAHECGHIVLLFKTGKFVSLRFLPHETAADGVNGILEADTGTELGPEDCVALAAGMVGELIYLGHSNPQRRADDEQKIQRIIGQPIENFAAKASEVIQQNQLFFEALNAEVRRKMLALFESFSEMDYAQLPKEIPIITLVEVDRVYRSAELESPGTHGKAGTPD